MRLPIDTTTLTFLCAGDSQPVVDYDSRRPKTDEAGTPLYQVAMVAISEGNTPEVLNVKVAGQPAGVASGVLVRLHELVAIPWDMGERSGIAYRATRIEPVTAPTGTGRADKASAA